MVRYSIARLSLFLVGLWCSSVAVALGTHRGADSSLTGILRSIATFGLSRSDRSITGLDNGWIIGVLVVSTVAVGILRSISSSRTEGVLRTSPRRSDPRTPFLDPGHRRGMWPAASTAVLSVCGLLFFGHGVFDLFARQHVERVVVDRETVEVLRLSGPLLPTFVWTSIAAGILGVLLLTPLLHCAFSSCLRDLHEYFEHRPDRRTSVGKWYSLHWIWVVSLGLWVRVATLLTVAPTRTDGGDPLFYHVTANLLAQGRGFPEPLNFIAFQRWIPSALHGPAYPIVLSISSRIGGTTYFDHKFLSILIGTGVVALTMWLAHLIAPKPMKVSTAFVSGLLAAVYPNLWLVDGVMFPEGLMALLVLGVVITAYRWWNGPTLTNAALMGALTAASALTRGEGLMLSVLLIVPVVLGFKVLPLKRRLVHLLLAAVSCIAILAPWSIRNARSFEVFVPLSTNGNELFVYANCPPVYEGKFLGFWLFQCQEDLRSEYGEPEGDEAQKAIHWREQGFEFAKNNAGDLPRVISARIGRQWEIFRPWQNTEFAPIEGRDKDAARIGLVSYYSMIPFALYGVFTLRRKKVRTFPFGSVFATVTLTAAYAYGTTRFRVPFEPLLCVLAAVGVSCFLGWLRHRWSASQDNERLNTLGPSNDRSSFVLGSDLEPSSALKRNSIPSWLSFFVVGTAIVLTLPALYRAVGSSMEEGFMLVFPELVNKGFVPNVDFLHLYGPGSLHALAMWFRMFDVSIIAERTFGLLQHVAFVAGMVVLTRPWGRIVSTVVGTSSLLFVLTPIGLQALAWNGALALGIWSVVFAIRATSRGTRSAWWGAGVCGGLALTFRPDIAVALGLGVGYLVFKRSRKELLWFGSALAFGLTPLWWHFGQAGPRAAFDGMFLDPVFRLRPGRELPRPPSLDRLDGALQVISEKFAPWWGFPHLDAPKQLFIWFFLLPLSTIGIVLIARAIPRHRRERSVLVAASLFGLGLLPQAVQRPDSAHLLWVSAVSWPLAIIAIVELFRRRFPRSHPRFQVAFATTVFSIVIVALVPFYTIRTYADLAVRSVTNQLDVREVRRGDRVFYLGDERPWRATLEVTDDLDRLIREGDRLFVGPVDLRQTAYSDSFFYHLFPEAVPSTYYIEMDPGLANSDARLARDVASADWLILTRFWSGWIEPNSSVDFGSDLPNQVVERNFCLHASYQNDLVRLFKRCSRGDGTGPYEGPYRPEHDYAVEVLVPVPPRPDGTCTPTCNGKPSSTGVEIGIDTSVIE